MLNKFRCIMMLAAMFCGAAAVADPTADKLSQIEVETLLLKARERQLDVQASILTKQNDIANRQSAINLLSHTPLPGDPVVQGVEGLGRELFATLQMSDGSVVDAQAGDVLSNGMRVVSVAPGAVIVQNASKKRVRLALHGQRQAAFNPNLPSPGVVLPLPPMAPKGAAGALGAMR